MLEDTIIDMVKDTIDTIMEENTIDTIIENMEKNIIDITNVLLLDLTERDL